MNMKHIIRDRPLLLCLTIAYLLLFFSYRDLSIFWYIYTASMACLFVLAYHVERPQNNFKLSGTLMIGFLSGMLMYIITWAASKVLPAVHPPLQNQLEDLYILLSPTETWQYAMLILLIIPGEEIFWRGLIEKRLLTHIKTVQAVLLSTLLYSLPLIFSGNLLLVLAGIGGGLLWGTIYAWKRSLSMVIFSHLLFDLLLLAAFPLVRL
ncbi:CPBP family intramembrane metalloprotease [Pradoshia eiseniae]|uniref:CPBP family intramembrane metalloprotease n=2 Tax=Pradoshia eiseniae TaxID=2064768 RepID=A0A2S7MYX1_9BACI|nr:CPBP family intramembrane metalloprotease [Pradoshia eiseniae]